MGYHEPEEILKFLNYAEDYRKKHLTGDQKTQEMIKLIKMKCDDLVVPKPIIIRSIELHFNFCVDDQIEVLKLLQDEYHCIEYEVKKDNIQVKHIPGMLVDKPSFPDDILMIDPPFVSDETIEERVTKNAKYYIINVLSNFPEAIEKIGPRTRPIYELKYLEFKSQIYFNDILLCTMQADSSSRKLFDLAFSSKGEFIAKPTINGYKLSKIFHNLKLNRPLYTLFFNIDSKGFRFRPAVYRYNIESEKIDTELIEKEIANLRDKIKTNKN